MSRPLPGFAAVDPPDRWTPTRGRFRPERLEAPIDSLTGVGPTLKKRLAKLGLEHVGDLLDHRPRRYERPAPEKRIADLIRRGRRGGLDRGRGAQHFAPPRARAAPDPHRPGLRRQRADLGDLVQPAVAEGQADAGHARAPPGPAKPVRLRRPLLRPERRLGDRGLRARLSGERGGLGGEAPGARRIGATARDRPARPAAGLPEGRARAAAPGRRARRAAPAALARRGRERQAKARVRRAARPPAGARAPGGRARGAGRGGAAPGPGS